MEYKILNLSESSSVEDAKRALRRIRAKYHPDRGKSSDAARRLVELAEEAHDVILRKHRIDGAFGPLIEGLARTPFQGMQTPFAADPTTSEVLTGFPEPGRRVYESSYSCTNVNGDVQESGRVNGRPMDESEMKRFRPREQLR